MAYRKVSMIEIKEILIRVAKGQTKRKIRRDLRVHGLTINRYIEEAKSLGINPENCDLSNITDDICAAIAKNSATVKKDNARLYPRDALLLPVKDRIEDYLNTGITKTKIVKLLERENILVTESSFLRFVKDHFSYLAKNITVRLPDTEPGQYAQADFGRLGKIWDETTKKYKIVHAFIVTLCCSRHMFVFITFKQDTRAVIEGCELAWQYFGAIPKILIFDNLWGYIPLDRIGAQLLFGVVSECYERKSLIINTDIEFSIWVNVFYDEQMTGAIIDRVLHHCHLLLFPGPSNRMRESALT